MRRSRRRHRWTFMERLLLHWYIWRGFGSYEIGERLGRTTAGVEAKAAELGLTVRRSR